MARALLTKTESRVSVRKVTIGAGLIISASLVLGTILTFIFGG